MKITILGRPCSKKNSKRNFISKSTHRFISLPSQAYENFKAIAIPQIRSFMYARDFKPFSTPIRVDYMFYRKGKFKQDIDNAISSINDLMQDAGLIMDDELIVCGTFNRESECKDWSTEVIITLLS